MERNVEGGQGGFQERASSRNSKLLETKNLWLEPARQRLFQTGEIRSFQRITSF